MSDLVKVISPDGQAGTVPQEHLPAFLDAGGELAPVAGPSLGTVAAKGAGIATALTGAASGGLLSPVAQTIGKAVARGIAPKVNAAEQSNRDAGGITGGLQGISDAFDATNMGIGQGLSAGLGEGALRQGVGAFSKEGGQAVEDWVNKARDENGFAHGAGNLVGMAGGMMAGGAGGAVGAFGEAGSLAEGAAASGLAKAGLGEGTAISRALGTAIKMGTRGAVEGGLYNAADAIGEDMLGDHELNAEKIAAAFGHGALMGGAIGAGLGGAASLAKSGAVEAAAAGKRGLARIIGGESPLANSVVREIGEKADELAVRSLGGGKATEKAAATFPGGTKGIGETLHKYNILDVAKAGEEEAGPLKAVWEAANGGRSDEILPRISNAKSEIGAQVGAVTQSSERVPVAPMLEKIQALFSRVDAGAVGVAAQEQAQSAITHLAKAMAPHIAADGTIELGELFRQRRLFDDLIFQGKGQTLKSTNVVLRDARNVIESHAVDHLEAAANREGGTVREKLKGLMHDYRAMSIAEEAATTGAEKVGANNQFGPRESIGALTGLANGHILGGAVVGIGGKLLRERGEAAASVLLKRISHMESVQAILAKVDASVEGAAKGLILPKAAKTAADRIAAAPPRAAARQLAQTIHKSQSDPTIVADNVGRSTADLAQVAPKTANAMAGVVGRSTAWIASQAPPTSSGDPLSPNRPSNMTDAEAAKFLRKAQAAHDPMKTLSDIERGHFNRDQIDALKATSPRLFAALQMKTLDQLADHVADGKEVPYAARLRLSLVLDVATDPSLKPDTMKKLQENVTAPPPEPAIASKGSNKAVKLSIPSISVYDTLEQHGTGRRKS